MYNNNMVQGFFQFNNSIINEILNFATSNFDLLFVNGKKGVAKSESIEKALSELDDRFLVFRHFCFINTAIDDFLLNFYDSLRTFYLSQKISLKKIHTDSFKEKVTHYFNSIPKNCLIVVENFENIDENVEIIDFLSYLAGYHNVKIIVVTRNGEKNLFRFKKIKIQNLSVQPISKEDFKAKLVILSEPLEDEIQEKFYEVTDGLELYLKMASKYSAVTGTKIPELLKEFQRKQKCFNTSFEEFIVTKFIALTPKTYLNFLKFLSLLSIPISLEFIKENKIDGANEAIKYLSKNFIINFFEDEVYIKDYFRRHILNTLSVQEKADNYSKLIKAFEKELEKSPKDRLIRLSRESIRKEIEFLKSTSPSVSSTKSSDSFSYLGTTSNGWQDENFHSKSKLAEKFNKIKERKKFLQNSLENEEKNQDTEEIREEVDEQKIIDFINSSRGLSNEYKYKEALIELNKATEADFNFEFKIEIAILRGKNYEKLNELEKAKDIYKEAIEFAINEKDERKSELEYLVADIDKNLYKLNEAKIGFSQIALNETNSAKYRKLSHIALGQIYEAEHNLEEALKHYLAVANLSLGKDKKMLCLAYYKLGLIYDEMGNWDNAVKYYRKNYITSSEFKENKYYSASLVNLGSIYSENSQYKEAIDCLKMAMNFDFENNDLENLYLTQKELAKLYTLIDENNTISYYKKALQTANELKDNFKVALVYFEVAQYYYDKLADDKALVNFLNARKLLNKDTDKENLKRIEQRIKDIKMRLDTVSFNMITEKYDEE